MNNNLNSSFFNNKRILITGATGFIGWNLINVLSKFDCTIICFSRNSQKDELINNNAKFEFITSDYQDEDKINQVVKNIDIIYHLAAQTSLYDAEKDPLLNYEANVKPMQLILEACRYQQKCPTIIFSATSTQCGLVQKLPINELVKDDPISFYDFNKLQSENLLKYYTKKGWVNGVSLRLTNVYGPGPKSSSADRGILNFMIKKALNGEDLTVYGSGEKIRDYVYIEDVVEVFIKSAYIINEIKGMHIILGSGTPTTIKDAVNIVADSTSTVIKKNINVVQVDIPKTYHEIENRNFVSDITLLRSKKMLSKICSLKNGIDLTINYYMNREKS